MDQYGERRARIARIFDEQGWENLDDLEAWDGEDLDALRELLSDEQFQALIDELGDDDGHDR